MVMEHMIDIITASLRIWHQSHIPVADFISASSKFELISKDLGHGTHIICPVVIYACSSHSGLGSNHNEISKRDLTTVLIVDLLQIDLLDTLHNTKVVLIIEVDAAVRATFLG